MVGTVVKSKIGEFEDKLRAVSSIRMRKYLTGVVHGFSGNKSFLVRFNDGCINSLSSNKLIIVIVEKILEEKEPEVYKIAEIPEDIVKLEKG